MIKKEKRYFFSVVEEGVLNPAFKGYYGGRIEVFDNEDKSGYSFYEARFLMPAELFEGFCKAFDMKESDLMPMIRWEIGNKQEERVKKQAME